MPADSMANAAVDALVSAGLYAPTTLSVWGWINLPSLASTSGNALFTSPYNNAVGGSVRHCRMADNAGNLRSRVTGAANGTKDTTGGPITAGVDYFVGWTSDPGATPNAHMYVGSLTAPVAECSYAGGASDVTTMQAEDAGTIAFANRWASSGMTTNSLGVKLAQCGFCGSILTAADFESLRQRPRLLGTSPSFYRPGFNGATTPVKDWGASARDLTVTNGAVVVGPLLNETSRSGLFLPSRFYRKVA